MIKKFTKKSNHDDDHKFYKKSNHHDDHKFYKKSDRHDDHKNYIKSVVMMIIKLGRIMAFAFYSYCECK